MSRLTTTLASSRETLRNRQPSATRRGSEEETTTEELLIEHLDKFLSSVESKLETFERYFKAEGEAKGKEKLARASDGCESRFRSDSTASLSSVKNYSLGNLQAIYNRMGMIKASVLRTSVSNLEILYYSLEEHYQYFSSPQEVEPVSGSGADRKSAHARAIARARASGVSSESIREGILKTIAFFDEKFTQVDDLIQARTPSPVLVDYNTPNFRQFKYFNFNRAVTIAKSRYLHYYELPLNWRENRYIINGYRFLMKHRKMLWSVFEFNHNESANIWSHIIGSLVMLYIMFFQFPQTELFVKNLLLDNLVIYLFLLAALNCMVLSSIWHTYSCFANYRIRSNFACIDYTGITVLITFSVVAVEYFALQEHTLIRSIYIGFSILCGATGFIFNWSPYFDKPECKSLRIGFFMGLAFLGACTFAIHMFYYGVVPALKFFSPLVYKSFVWYWIGVVFYGGLIPERWRYDVVINEDSTHKHNRSAIEVLTDGVEHSGLEEIEEIKEEQRENERECGGDVEKVDHKFQDIISNHFPITPTFTPYHNDFMSLWWVDYIFQSHNLWHVCVLLGVLGHYLCVLDMNEQLYT